MDNNPTTEQLKKFINPVGYNSAGIKPISSIYNVTLGILEREIKAISSKSISDIDCLSFIPVNKGMVTTVIWIRGDSKHFKDDSTVNTAIGKPIRKYSNELKDFVGKYGENQNSKKPNINQSIVYPRENDGRNLVGIKINLMRFIKLIFDVDNFDYNKNMGTNTRGNCVLSATWHFKSHRDNPFSEIEYLEVEKRERNILKDKAPRAIKSGRF